MKQSEHHQCLCQCQCQCIKVDWLADNQPIIMIIRQSQIVNTWFWSWLSNVSASYATCEPCHASPTSTTTICGSKSSTKAPKAQQHKSHSPVTIPITTTCRRTSSQTCLSESYKTSLFWVRAAVTTNEPRPICSSTTGPEVSEWSQALSEYVLQEIERALARDSRRNRRWKRCFVRHSVSFWFPRRDCSLFYPFPSCSVRSRVY